MEAIATVGATTALMEATAILTETPIATLKVTALAAAVLPV
jgi:hypothetical protein